MSKSLVKITGVVILLLVTIINPFWSAEAQMQEDGKGDLEVRPEEQ